jgi:hypothetical protein
MPAANTTYTGFIRGFTMDLLSKWSQRMLEDSLPVTHGRGAAVSEMVLDFTARYMELWWACDRSQPQFQVTYPAAEQAAREKRLEKLADGLAYEIKRMPLNPADRQVWAGQLEPRLRPAMLDFGRDALNLEQRHLDFIEKCGMVEASREFARMARRFDPNISTDDIYQAGRNVMTANFMQVLLGLPVEVTPSIFAYSMLYPYTDNYLDDPSISRTTKLAFNHRFQRRLMGEDIHQANPHEATISNLVGMIEGQWNRAHYPQVYASLLAIHAAQARSMGLVAPGASPYELDVLGISFEKGGTSVLADGYLVAGWLSPEQARFMYGYGAFTQLMDDLEDIQSDLSEGRATVFTQTAGRWPLDGLTNRIFHFGRATFGDLSAFATPAVEPMSELIERGIDPVLIDIIGRAGKYYSKEYLRELERHMPYRFSTLKKQREKLGRQKIDVGSLIETML